MAVPAIEGESIIIPGGLHGGKEIFQPLAQKLGLPLSVYDPSVIRSYKSGEVTGLIELFERKPALLVIPTSLPVGNALLELADGRVKAFGSASTGKDHVDLEAMKKHGVNFYHAPGANSASVAEYVICSLPFLFSDQRLLARDLVIGIVGFGKIGSLLASFLNDLRIQWRACDPFVDEAPFSLDEVLQCDLVSFHVPLTVDSKHPTFEMVTEEKLKSVSRPGVLVNTARGKIFSEKAFQYAMESFRTVMDVFREEPPSVANINGCDYVTPHVAGYNFSARTGSVAMLAETFARAHGIHFIAPEIELPRTDLHIIDFLLTESTGLKTNPGSFRIRRDQYPARAGLGDSPSQNKRTEFQKQLLAIWKRRNIEKN